MSADVSFKWPDFNLLLFVLNTNIKKREKGRIFYDISTRVVLFLKKDEKSLKKEESIINKNYFEALMLLSGTLLKISAWAVSLPSHSIGNQADLWSLIPGKNCLKIYFF